MKAIKSGFSSIYKHRMKGLIGLLIIAAGAFSYDMYQKSFQDAVKDTGHVVTASYDSTKDFIKNTIAAW